MKDQQTGSGGNKGSASPFEQTQRILNEIIEQIRGLEWSECFAKLDKKNEADKVKLIIGNDIKTEHDEEREAADWKQQQIEVIEEVKAAERLQRNCEYVRGLCKLTIEHKRDNREAIEGAKKVLELLPKIEKGDYSLWRELDDATYILLSELEDNRGPSAKGRHPQPKTRKVPAETKQKAAPSPIHIQNSNVILGDVNQPGNLQVGDHTQIHKQAKAEEQNKSTFVRVLQFLGWLWTQVKWLWANVWPK